MPSTRHAHAAPALDPERKAELSRKLAANPGLILEQLAQTQQCPLASVIECLPAAMWRKMPGARFVEIMQAVAGWQTPVTLLIHSADAILEFTGPLPAGEIGHGFYNLRGGNGLHGHLRHQNCAAIYLLERPFMGKATVSLNFCNPAGEAMFKIFAGRDAGGNLLAEQLAALRALPHRHEDDA